MSKFFRVLGSIASTGSEEAVEVSPPSISVHPQNQTVNDNTVIQFTVTASGTDIQYQWQRSTNGGGAWSNISGETLSSLSLVALTALSTYQYRCVVSNVAGSVNSNAAVLTVNPTTLVININMVVGNTGALTADDTYWKALIESYGYTVTLKDDNDAEQFTTDGVEGAFVSSSCVEATLLDKYDGKGANSVPVFHSRRVNWDNAGLADGNASTETAVTTVEYESSTEITWPGKTVGQDYTLFSPATDIIKRASGTTGSGVNVVLTSPSDATEYLMWCYEAGATAYTGAALTARAVGFSPAVGNATNLTADGEALMEAAFDWLWGTPSAGAVAPTITAHPVAVTGSNGQTVTFSVSADGTSPLTYQWQFNGTGSWVNIGGATSASYQRTLATSDDTDAVRCVVTNGAGSVNSNSAAITITASWTPPDSFGETGSTYHVGGGNNDYATLSAAMSVRASFPENSVLVVYPGGWTGGTITGPGKATALPNLTIRPSADNVEVNSQWMILGHTNLRIAGRFNFNAISVIKSCARVWIESRSGSRPLFTRQLDLYGVNEDITLNNIEASYGGAGGHADNGNFCDLRVNHSDHGSLAKDVSFGAQKAQRIVWYDCDISDYPVDGITAFEVNDLIIDSCRIYRMWHTAASPAHADGISIKQACSNVIIRKNEIYLCLYQGIIVSGTCTQGDNGAGYPSGCGFWNHANGGVADQVYIHHNLIYAMGTSVIKRLVANTGLPDLNAGVGIQVSNAYDVWIWNNTILDCHAAAMKFDDTTNSPVTNYTTASWSPRFFNNVFDEVDRDTSSSANPTYYNYNVRPYTGSYTTVGANDLANGTDPKVSGYTKSTGYSTVAMTGIPDADSPLLGAGEDASARVTGYPSFGGTMETFDMNGVVDTAPYNIGGLNRA